MVALQRRRISRCLASSIAAPLANLVALPKIGGLTALKTLNLSECRSLVSLPKMPRPNAPGVDVRNISYGRLKTLCLGGCTSLRSIPTFIQANRLKDIFLDVSGASRGVQEKYRRLNRRTCDTCRRQGLLDMERFPVCYCGARRYCNEYCQKIDWEKGHSKTCASGHTFDQGILDKLRYSPALDRDAIFKQYPPPADRER